MTHNGGVNVFGHRPPADVLGRLHAHLGRRPRVLAWARAAMGVVVAVWDRLCVPDADGWRDVPWHDILGGGWDREAGELRWSRLSSGERDAVALVDARDLPEVFRERVEATFLVRQAVHPQPGRTVMITARRALGDSGGSIVWTAHPIGGVRLEGETLAFVEERLAELRAEYAF